MDKRTVVYRCPITSKYLDPSEVLRAYGTDEDVPVATMRTALKMPPIDEVTGIGYLEHDVLKSHDAFCEWLEGKGDGVESGGRFAAPTESLQLSTPKTCLHCG